MALVVKDRVKETTTTTGTGTLTLAGAMSGFQAFSVIGNANTTYYAIYEPSGTDWEVGIGTYTLSGTTLSRDTILASSNAGAAVNFGAGTKVVFCTYPAGKSVYLDAAGEASVNINGTVGATTPTTGAFTTISATGVVTVSAGAVGAPSIISTTGTADTGQWFPAADTIAWSTAGSERMRINNVGSVGIGTTALTGINLKITKNITGATDSRGVQSDGQIQSDVTSVARYYISIAGTQNAVFTLSNLRHYEAYQGTFGASSTVTVQSGYYVDASLIGATTNYGFYSNIASGTGRWNLYMNGTASNYMAGDLLLGTTTPDTTTPKLDILDSGGIQMLLTDSVTDGGTKNVRFGARHYTNAEQPFGFYLASTASTNVISYGGGSSLLNAATLHGFYTAENNTTTTGTERMRINNVGSVGIGTTALTGYSLHVSKDITGATTALGIVNDGQIQTDVTNAAYGIRSYMGVAAAATVSTIASIIAEQATFGAGATVTNQFSFLAGSSLTGATNNYGFYSNIASGTGRWNFYANGTANNYMAGSFGIGTTSLTARTLHIGKSMTGGTTVYGLESDGTIQSDATTSATYFSSSARTAAATFTVATLRHFRAEQNALGAGSSITNQYGFIADSNLTSATNNYGFFSSIASGTGRWNLYMNGDAQNYLAAGVNIGGTGDGAWIDDSSHGSTSTTMYIGNQSINTTSDYRLKTNIVNTEANALNVINNLRVVDFEWDDPTDTSWNNKNARGKWTGLIAQEAINHIPYVVNAPRNKETMEPIPEYKDCHGNDIYWFIEYQHMVPMLVKAIQELTDRLNALESQN